MLHESKFVQLAASSSPSGRAAVVDAHVHLWRYRPEHYNWIHDDMAEIRRSFSEQDLIPLMKLAAVDKAIVVQARETLEETEDLLNSTRDSSRIAGVIGWLPLCNPAATEAALNVYGCEPKLLGVRYIAQGQPAGFLDDALFNESIRMLRTNGLVYDILIYEHQLAEAVRFVDRHPEQPFVVDHLAKPQVGAGTNGPWASLIRELGSRPNVSCKVSGLTTEARGTHWSPTTPEFYLDVAVDAFGMERLLVGSDWPVCLLESSYNAWWTLLRNYFQDINQADQSKVFGGNAERIYALTSGKGLRGHDA